MQARLCSVVGSMRSTREKYVIDRAGKLLNVICCVHLFFTDEVQWFVSLVDYMFVSFRSHGPHKLHGHDWSHYKALNVTNISSNNHITIRFRMLGTSSIFY